MASGYFLDSYRGHPGSCVPPDEADPHKDSTYQGLDPLGSLESLASALKLRTSDFSANTTDLCARQPAAEVSLNHGSSHLPLPDLLILCFPLHAAQIPSPHTLNFQRRPKLFLCPNRLSPHTKTYEKATCVTLDGDNILHMPAKFLKQLLILPAHPLSFPQLADVRCSLVHFLELVRPDLVDPLDGRIPTSHGLQLCCRVVLLKLSSVLLQFLCRASSALNSSIDALDMEG
mmetsp:Transcript_26891/g.50561  ORF Transcript_26891/g.50561 Transcript_26891/m.50561 type:complete len:231 (-) Transcript_26891:535-1227(-)